MICYRVFAFITLFFSLSGYGEDPKPPKAKKVPVVLNRHGDTRVDEYYWLREIENPEVLSYIKQENEYTKAFLEARAKGLQDMLYQEMVSRLPTLYCSLPYKKGNYWYYNRYERNKEYTIHCRKKGSEAGVEEVYFDENVLVKGKFFSVHAFSVSPNGEFLAYSVDQKGDESCSLFIKNLLTGDLLQGTITSVTEDVVWGNDNKTLFYIVQDKTKSNYRVFRHQLGKESQADVVVFQENTLESQRNSYKMDHQLFKEKDSHFALNLYKSKDQRYVFLKAQSSVTSETYYLDADQCEGNFEVIFPRKKGVDYIVEHREGEFLILTNESDPNYRLIALSDKKPLSKVSREIFSESNDVSITEMEVFEKGVMLYEKKDGLQRFCYLPLQKGKEVRYVNFSAPVFTIDMWGNFDYFSHKVRFSYESLITPTTVYEYDMNKDEMEAKVKDKYFGYDETLYEMKREFVLAKDGTKIPFSIVYKKGIKLDGKNPLLLTGYGAYNYGFPNGFSSELLSLLDRGFVYVYAHVRGGGAFGLPWYNHGRRLEKKNTFLDFICVAEGLIEKGYTSSDRLVSMGMSAGGLLMGVVVNMRPELFCGVVALVPFVDVVTTMSDPTIPNTLLEYEEWGNPENKEEYFYMKSYSPYDNVSKKKYPPMLVTASLYDSRVCYWEPLKWGCRLRDVKEGDSPLLIQVNMEGDHCGMSGQLSQIKELAGIYSFILDVVKKK
ncbi:MAG: S9 family peptidase [Chlamydiota bacterium]